MYIHSPQVHQISNRKLPILSKYYKGRHTQDYNVRWHTLIERTHAKVLGAVDFTALRGIPEQLGRQPRVLDIACGTGLLLKKLLSHIPDLHTYGIDASTDMLSQAYAILKDSPNVHLQHEALGVGKGPNFPHLLHGFDLITCTNALHYLPDLIVILTALEQLLAPGGHIVIQDYVLPEPPFPWKVLERLVPWPPHQYMHEYTLTDALSLGSAIGFQSTFSQTFIIDRVTTLFPI